MPFFPLLTRKTPSNNRKKHPVRCEARPTGNVRPAVWLALTVAAFGTLGVAPAARAGAEAPALHGSLDETAVVQAARARPAHLHADDARRAQRDAAVGDAAAWASPVLSWDYESSAGQDAGTQAATASTQHIVGLTVPLPSGQQAASARALSADAALAHAQDVARTEARVRAALAALHDAQAAAARAVVRETAHAALAEAARVMRARADRGMAAGAAAARLHAAALAAKARLDHACGQAAAARARLEGHVGRAVPAGALAPAQLDMPGPAPGVTPGSQLAEPNTAPRTLAALDAAHTAAQDARAAAGWAWWPALSVTAGYKGTTDAVMAASVNGTGYAVGLSMALPVTGRAVHATRRAHAQARLHTALRDLEATRLATQTAAAAADLAGAQDGLRAATTALDAMRTARAAADAGYRAGTTPLLDLLEVHRAWADLALQRITLWRAVKRAHTTLRASQGGLS